MILVTGASGHVGRELIGLLSDAGRGCRATSRDPAALSLPAGVEVAQADLEEPASLAGALGGVECVYLMGYGDAMPRHAANMARAAADAGVRHVVLLSSGGVERTPMSQIGKVHGAAEQAVLDAGVPWTFLRPGPFHSNTEWWVPAIRGGETRIRHPFGNAPGAPIDAHDVAAVAAAVIGRDEHFGKAYLLTGPERLRPQDQLEIVAAALGRTLAFETMTREESREFLGQYMSDPQAIDDTIDELLDEHTPWRDPLPHAEALSGQRSRSYREWVERNVDRFR